MKNKIVAVIVALGGLACLAAVPASSAQAAGSSAKSAPQQVCPHGTAVLSYCVKSCPPGETIVDSYCETCPPGDSLASGYCEICPKGTTLVSGYCETRNGKIVAAGPPTVFGWTLWGAGEHYYHGAALKFHVKKGINGAPSIKSLTCSLPDGLTFERHGSSGGISITTTTLTLKLGKGVGSVLAYLKNHSMIETQALRNQIIAGTVKSLTFHLTVTDAAGKTTKLAFNVKPQG